MPSTPPSSEQILQAQNANKGKALTPKQVANITSTPTTKPTDPTPAQAPTPPSAPTGSSTNLPFDDRYHAPNPFAGPLFRGNLQRRDNPNRKFFFLFNPNTIQIGYGSMQGQLNAASIDLQAAAQTLTTSLVTWGFSLLFDRHYEVMYQNDTKGVLRDLEAFESLVGFLAYEKHMGVIDWVAYDWFLGEQFQFFGRVSSCQVALSLFNHNMIPMRAEMQLQGEGMFGNLTQQPDNTQALYQSSVAAVSKQPFVTPQKPVVVKNGSSTRVIDGVTRVGGLAHFPS